MATGREMKFLEHQGQPDADAVRSQREAELDDCQDQNPAVLQGSEQRSVRPLPHFRRQGTLPAPRALPRSARMPIFGLSASRPSVRKPKGMHGKLTSRNSHCQPASPQIPSIPSSQLHTGPPTSEESGNPDQEPGQHAGAVLRSETRPRGRRSRPERTRLRQRRAENARRKNCSVQHKAVVADTIPQVIMIRASQRRAPNRYNKRLLGTSNTDSPERKFRRPDQIGWPTVRAAGSSSARQNRGWYDRDS